MSAQKKSDKRSGSVGKQYSGKKSGQKSKYVGSIDPANNLYLSIPLFLIIAIVPLIIYVKKLIVNDPGNLYWDGQGTHYDIFSYYKMVYLLVFTGAGALLYLFMRTGNPFEKAKRPYYIPLGTFALLTLISAVASDYKEVAFFGFLDRFEGALVLIAYCVIAFLAMNILTEEKIIKVLFICLLASAAVISIIGLFQYLGINYFDSNFISQLITPAYLLKQGGRIKPNLTGNLIYSTLYNPNYVGSYIAMLIPILIILLTFFKKFWQKAALIILLLLAIINLVGSDSRAGMIGTACAVVILVVIFRKNIITNKWIALSAIFILAGGLIIFNYVTDGSITNRISRFATLENKEGESNKQKTIDKALTGLSDVMLDDSKLELVTDKGTFKLSITNSKIKILDENDSAISSKMVDNNIVINDKRFSNIKLSAQPENSIIKVNYNRIHLLDIVLTNEGLRSTSNRWMTYRNGRKIETIDLNGKESFGSNRVYIWSRSIPLLKNTLLIGNGPDTFALFFPQYDFVNKLKYYENGGIFVDKAHDFYLQTALNTGGLSLLALLVLFCIYIISSIKLYFTKNVLGAGFLTSAGTACFAAFCGYILSAFFNDSVIAVAPVFWVLLGMGIGINIRLNTARKV